MATCRRRPGRASDEDPSAVLARRANQRHNPYALLDRQRTPDRYVREYASDFSGMVRKFSDLAAN